MCRSTHLKKNGKYHYPPWFNGEIINCLRKKNFYFKKYKKTKRDDILSLFKHYRSCSKSLIFSAHKTHIRVTQESLTNNPKNFWKFVQQKKSATRIPGLMKYNNQELHDPLSIVNAFSNYFSSVYNQSKQTVNKNDASSPINNITVSIDNITEEEIFQALVRSKDSFTSGVDGIPSFLVKDCAHIFVKPLFYLFNLIVKTSTFPAVWKKSVCPVFKKGDISDVHNYRPIALLSNFAKIFETILYRRIYPNIKHIITPTQHGFMEKRSTVTNLLHFTQDVAVELDVNGQVDVVYTDFQKAFDQMDYFILLDKLRHIGFSSFLLDLLTSYLVNVNAFSNYFSSVYNQSKQTVNKNDASSPINNITVSIDNITEEEIFQALVRSKDSFTSGVDGIPSFLVKDCAHIFVKPLFYLFNLIVKTSTFPALWKKSVCPVFKKGDISDVHNYRPIALLSNFAKIFETILYRRIYPNIKHIITPTQHGFMEKRSTVTNLLHFTQDVAVELDVNGQVDVVYTDFQKRLTKWIILYFSINTAHSFSSFLLDL
ncbi:hypothetical protein TcasGA2_TC006175 [Tribolium castaneum]|uniref:Reverse transcriptase domain-containing protein n=1 Tax=Tribolium castaneum TaxID=7070 RepID=D6WV13_TRICA|nr:hypothetical protein TcasGA2_TC006175 [Tribolium castaneum]